MSAGIKPTAIVSYNHLGNNDGKNLQVRGRVRGRGRGTVRARCRFVSDPSPTADPKLVGLYR